ncbi:hypothetical protein BU23DRAFT_211274 [Bimuria novae-zelandiae CBS 107.79]|uniref:F-box domain-containing protein n=1 Tax=Bimuria novae-zelandiae CBS 107.79 TaxID=1447943 RepID=A0A6A5VAN4_9PLEO|nr:hypothetical protein BU23DRAFT_211274 [Bimuria novae-zelandiae CBS 107.79]
MAFGEIPPELILSVAEILDPFSCLDFALTCKAHWKLCESLIAEHKRLFAENRTIDAGDSAWPAENHILWNKLKEFLANPRIGEHVREISLPGSRAVYLQGDASHSHQLTEPYVQPPQEDLDRYGVVKRELEELYGDGGWTLLWDERISQGSSEPIIVMLGHYTPFFSQGVPVHGRRDERHLYGTPVPHRVSLPRPCSCAQTAFSAPHYCGSCTLGHGNVV